MSAEYHHDDELQSKVYDHRLMKRLLRYLRPYLGLFSFALFLAVVLTGLTLAGPLVVREFIEAVQANAPDGPRWFTQWVASLAGGVYGGDDGWTLLGAEPADLLVWFAGVLLLVVAVDFGVRYAQGFTIQLLGQRVLHDLRLDLFTHVQRLPVDFFQKQPVGRLVTRLTNDINSLNELFSGALIPIFMNLLTVVGIGVALVLTNTTLGLLALSVLPVIILVTFVFQIFIRKYYRDSRKQLSRINAFLAEQVNGMREVQLFHREAHDKERFRDINNSHYLAMKKALRVQGFFRPIVTSLYSLALALVLWYGGGQVVQRAISLGDLFLFVQLMQHFYGPIQHLAQQYAVIQAAMASSERIFQLMDTENTMKEAAAPRDADLHTRGARGHVRFEGVHFRYRSDDPILRGIDIEARPGEHIALVGHTGAGKSTCIHLLGRYYDVDEGRITLDGIDIRDLSLAALRRHLAVVHQDVFCFATSVAANIDLGDASIGRDRVIECSKAVNAHSFIEKLPRGYDTAVTEGGKTFSLGERQLLAFARALAYDPAILVLDEATANIDTHTERLIQGALQSLIAGRTAIIIAHRLSTIQACDRIYLLDHGLVAEVGTHEELLGKNGRYAELYRQQFADQADEPAAAPGGYASGAAN